jgi:surface antigen
MSVDEFVSKYNGKAVDFDGAYGAQCWDLVAQYSREVVGLPGGAWQVMPTGPNGGASEIYTNFMNPLGQYYEKIANTPDPNQLPQKGDIIIWNWAPYGHTAICLGATSNSITVFEENSPIGSAAHITPNKTWSGVLGWIRPKNLTQGEIMNGSDVTNMYRVLLGREPDPSGLAAYTGRTWNDAFYSISGSQEFKNRQQANADLINGLRVALENEQKKPPKEVIKEVEKIVIQEVTKEVPVYTHDTETKENVNKLVSMVTSIFDYFKGQYKSFSKYVKKEK